MALRSDYTIAVDIDEVLGHFIPQICLFHNEKYGTSLTAADFHSYNFWEVWGGSRDESINLPTVPDAAEILNKLKVKYGFTFVVVTSRQLDIETATKEWLDCHYPGIFSHVRFGHHFSHSNDNRVACTKAQMCQELNAKMLIDDSYSYAIQCSPVLEHVFLFDYQHSYPWNKSPSNEILPKNVTRVKDWHQVYEQIDSKFSS